MDRVEYIRSQQKAGRSALGVLPIHYPKELLTALDILAVEMWGPPGPPRGPDAGRIQSYVCAVARNALAFIASGTADVVDGLLFPHTCDSIQGLSTVVTDLGGWSNPSFRFFHPKGDDRPSARRFMGRELRALAAELEPFSNSTLDNQRLLEAILLHREIDLLRANLLDQRATLVMSDPELYSILRRGEFLWPEDHLTELKRTAEKMGSSPSMKGTAILVTGIVPEPMSIFEAFNDAGLYVAADDYAAIGRRVNRRPPDSLHDPFAALIELYSSATPCPTRQANQMQRAEYLSKLLGRSNSRGVVIHTVKFCEPELFDVPVIQRRFAERGIPVLYLESELEQQLTGQTITRIEAFGEMLGRSKTAGAA
jgi:benzoyl-CoA reductase/2-hydroxyglutaryl-CoA dehydratase subunit BcrC/BadD/HgdB